MKVNHISVIVVFIATFIFVYLNIQKVYAATSPSLGTAATYSILAGSSVTNTGATVISGDVGISPGAGGSPNYTGFGSVTLGGTIHDADATALTAMNDKNAAYTSLGSQSCDTDYGAITKDLAGLTLTPGVYCATSFHLTGTLTLNGTATDVWIFKSGSDLILTGGAAVNVVFTGGGQACNVWWRVVSTATFDANSTLVGNILADTSITFAAGSSLNGRALARSAAVTLSSTSITGPTCVIPTATPTASPSPAPTTAPTASPTAGPTTAPSSSIASSNTTSGTSSNSNCAALSSNIVAPNIIGSRRVDANSIFISWGPYSGVNTFNVQYGFSNGNWTYNTDVTGFSTIISGLPSNQPIWVRVAARNSCTIGNYGKPIFVGGPMLPNTGIGP